MTEQPQRPEQFTCQVRRSGSCATVRLSAGARERHGLPDHPLAVKSLDLTKIPYVVLATGRAEEVLASELEGERRSVDQRWVGAREAPVTTTGEPEPLPRVVLRLLTFRERVVGGADDAFVLVTDLGRNHYWDLPEQYLADAAAPATQPNRARSGVPSGGRVKAIRPT
jgi:hypothetical protein